MNTWYELLVIFILSFSFAYSYLSYKEFAAKGSLWPIFFLAASMTTFGVLLERVITYAVVMALKIYVEYLKEEYDAGMVETVYAIFGLC